MQLEVAKWYKTRDGQTVHIDCLHESSGAMIGSVLEKVYRDQPPSRINPTVWKQNGEHFYANPDIDIVEEIG